VCTGSINALGYDRKEAKRYGDPVDQDIVGDLRDGDAVLMVDDVVVTGKTKIDNWEKLTGYRRLTKTGATPQKS
jgi:orotate phosphoribosyltransferase